MWWFGHALRQLGCGSRTPRCARPAGEAVAVARHDSRRAPPGSRRACRAAPPGSRPARPRARSCCPPRPRCTCPPAPRRKALRFVPFSRAISARAASSGSWIASAPPSPQLTFFVSWKLRQPASPSVPSARPRQRGREPLRRVLDDAQPSAARRSRRARPCRAPRPRSATGRIAAVRGVSRRSTSCGVEAERAVLDVGEHGPGADAQHRVGAGHEGERGADHLVARADAEGEQRELERVRARGREQHAVHAEHAGEARLDAAAGRPVAAGLDGERGAHGLDLALVVARLRERDGAWGVVAHGAGIITFNARASGPAPRVDREQRPGAPTVTTARNGVSQAPSQPRGAGLPSPAARGA